MNVGLAANSNTHSTEKKFLYFPLQDIAGK